MDALKTDNTPGKFQETQTELFRRLSKYEKPDTGKAIRQLLDTFIPYAAVWGALIYLIQHGYSYWLAVPLIVLAAGFLNRIFIFFHDCGHGSFLPSRRANRLVGFITGVLAFTPYDDWWHEHAVHHSSAGDLDRRGHGDVWTMTVAEYLRASKWTRLGYRLYRNPAVLFILGPLFLFFFRHRLWHPKSGKRERLSVIYCNLGLAAIVLLSHFTIGIKTYLLIQIPIMTVAGVWGVWLFYVQHQYEDVYWAEHDDWKFEQAALAGSSYYKLPKVLQWFSGNIGLHHIHHLRSRIPNYLLQECYTEVPEMRAVKPLTFMKSLKSLFYRLFDEQSGRMVSFRALKHMKLSDDRA